MLHDRLSTVRLRYYDVTKCDIFWNGLRNAKLTWICSVLYIGGHSVSQIGRVKWVGHTATFEGEEIYIPGLVRKPERKRWSGRYGGSWKAGIKMYLKVIWME